MGVYKIFPSQDTTIYTDYNTLNAGLDSILDLSKNPPFLFPSSSTSRVLLKFDSSDIADAIAKTGANFTASLRLYNATVEGIPTNFNLDIYPVYESWDMGTGRFNNIPETDDGASWKYRSSNQTNAWATSGTGVGTSYYTGNEGGGNWLTAYYYTQSFSYFTTKDINVNVTTAVNAWNNNTISNNGFIIKNSSTNGFEFNYNYNFIFNFFSRDTNTIYPPCLEFKWNDSTFNPGVDVITTDNLLLSIGNNKTVFYEDEYVKFKVYAKEKYPARTFSQVSLHQYNKALPSSSYYSIIDLDTNNTVIGFDTIATKLSADSDGSYFRLYMNGLEPDRYYKIQIKSVIDGGTYIYDNDYYFKVMQNV
jgi:hypothetical protein